MSKLEQFDTPPIKQVYQQESQNASIEFGTNQISISDHNQGNFLPVTGHISLRFIPNDSLEVVIPTSDVKSQFKDLGNLFLNNGDERTKLHLPDYGTSFDVFLKASSTERSIYCPKHSPMQVYQRSDSISKSIFHLLNWPNFSGPENYVLRTGTSPHFGFSVCGQFILEIDGWKITIAATENTRSLLDSLKETGGYIITHVGEIRRSNGEDFSTEKLDDLCSFLSFYFSFVLGRWSSLSLAVGFDTSGNRVYEEWGLRRCTNGLWSGSNTWFDQEHAEFFSAVLPGFWNLWSNDVWNHPLTEAIYWYLSANHAGPELGVDSALLFTQAALELLSWTSCVLDRQMVSAKAYGPGKLSAADKLRLLVSSLNIPLMIPSCLTDLHAALNAKQGRKWEDSMDAITDLRNGLVHPGKNNSYSSGAYFDAWRLSQWYIELVLLRLCEYSGNYANRLSQRFTGQIEPVPWVS